MNEYTKPINLPLAIGFSALLMIASVASFFAGLVQMQGAGMFLVSAFLPFGVFSAISVLLAALISPQAVFQQARRIVVAVFVILSVVGMFAAGGVRYEFLSNL